MKTILFVDDESAMLLLYEMALKHRGEDWELFFAKNGQEALALMEQRPIDVVISDLVMPRMDGVEFLNEVLRRFPQTIRCILSGHIGAEDVAKSINAVHQYLRKPCDFATLKTTLIRVCSLDVFVQNKELQKLVASMTVVPSLPSLYFRMMQELESPNSPVEQIAALVEQDPGMAAKLLQLSNSAFLGIQHRVSTPAGAVQLLGVKTVRSLALYFHTIASFQQARMAEFSLDQHWSHCFRTGLYAKMIAHMETGNGLIEDEAFIAGLLHDVGKLMLVSNITDQFRAASTLAKERRMPLWEAEKEVFGASHADVGAYLLGLWGLPISIIEAVALHHCPAKASTRLVCPLTAVHIANALEHERSGTDFAQNSARLDEEYIGALGLKDRLEKWRAISSQLPSQTTEER